MEAIKLFEEKEQKVIRKELLINGGDLDIYLDLFLTDKNGRKEHVLTKKGDSILANFLRILYLQMGRDTRNNVMGGTFYRLLTTITAGGNPGISSLSAGTSNKIRITFTTSILSGQTSGKITLGGFQGVNIDGRYDWKRISDSIIELEETTYSSGWTTGTGGVAIYVPITNLVNPSYNSFANSGIIIGTGTSPVTIDDNLLEKQIPSTSAKGGLIYNSSIVSQDTNDSASVQITFTRTFTNNSSITVQVNEIGLLMKAGTSSYNLLVMRDLISGGVNVNPGKTLTVNYRIKTTLNSGTDAGGFLVPFMRLLYRHAGQTSRAIIDINNVSRLHYPDLISFSAINSGGEVKLYPNYENESAWKQGILIGMSDTPVSMGDYNLGSLIQHGKSTNQMLYYGGFAEDFEIGSNYAQFNIVKAFENNSGNTIQVKEYGITGASSDRTSIGDSSSYQAFLFLLARNVLSSPINVDNGKILKVVYTIKVIVGS